MYIINHLVSDIAITTGASMMPAIPMVMSQEINFVFVPVADTTDAE